MEESTQHKLDRVRPPRVQITYDVEIGNAIEKKELPLVVGILADLSGKPKENQAKLSERRFIEIDSENFDKVLESIAPSISVDVINTISNDDKRLSTTLSFNKIEDFDPINVVKKVEALKVLFDARERLRDLQTKLDGNDKLDEFLKEVLSSTEKDLEALKAARSTGTSDTIKVDGTPTENELTPSEVDAVTPKEKND